MERVFRITLMLMVFGMFLGCSQNKSGSIEGKVVDGKGQPMSKVKMIAKQMQPIKGYEQFETTTGEDGKFVFKGLFPSSEYEIFPYLDNQTAGVRLMLKSGPEGQTMMLPEPLKIRFTKTKDGVITDNATGLEWYVGPDRDIFWPEAKTWAESLTAAGGGWRMPTVSELKALLTKGAPNNMHPVFQSKITIVWSGQISGDKKAWFVSFGDGKEFEDTFFGLVAANHKAFAVRSRR